MRAGKMAASNIKLPSQRKPRLERAERGRKEFLDSEKEWNELHEDVDGK